MIIDGIGSGYGYEKPHGMHGHHGSHSPSGMHMMHNKPHMGPHSHHGGNGPFSGHNMGGPHHQNPMSGYGMYGSGMGGSSVCQESYKVENMPGRHYEDMHVQRMSSGPNVPRYYEHNEGASRDGCNSSQWMSKGI
ncbi:hypothetical protein ACFE04_024918 [Oxalis oulophora]